jgi:hypothetical protein
MTRKLGIDIAEMVYDPSMEALPYLHTSTRRPTPLE